MRYLVICKDQTAFKTDWYDYEKFWNGETIHCVADLLECRVTFNGRDWNDMTYDFL